MDQVLSANRKLHGIAHCTVTRHGFNEKVGPYSIVHSSVSYLGLGPNYKLTLGPEPVRHRSALCHHLRWQHRGGQLVGTARGRSARL